MAVRKSAKNRCSLLVARCSSRLVDLLLAQKPYFEKLALNLAQSICGRVSCARNLPGISGIQLDLSLQKKSPSGGSFCGLSRVP